MSPKIPTAGFQRYQLQCAGLPLAIYREVAAHLRQVEGVETGLTEQNSDHFDYHQSQVGSLWLQYPEDLDPAAQQQVEQILDYYSSRFSPWTNI
jgi:hypothetical protein